MQAQSKPGVTSIADPADQTYGDRTGAHRRPV
jgi:hypothetical protein